MSYIPWVSHEDHQLHIRPPARPLDEGSTDRLRAALAACPDVAFAYLVDVEVEGISGQPSLSLFVWLESGSVMSLRGSLNLVSEAVAGAIPNDRFVDVLILNSAPELLQDVERSGCLFVERDAGERQRALQAAIRSPGDGSG
jgi:hypothetical protein